LFGRWRWQAYESASQGGWGATIRMVVLMAAGFLFSGSLFGLVVLVIGHHMAWPLVCQHTPASVHHWLGARCRTPR
jgi:fatty acid desaturase